jgi:amino acid transporter
LELVSSSVLERLLLSPGRFMIALTKSTYLTVHSPGSILIAYTSVGLLVYVVMTALGEMAAWIPHSSGFAGYATRFCDPALGFALGWTYWCKYIITTPNQLTATALIIQEWKTENQVNPGVWVAIFLFTIICVNYFGIKFFGELEFWLSTIKVITIVSSVYSTYSTCMTDDITRLVSSFYPSF